MCVWLSDKTDAKQLRARRAKQIPLHMSECLSEMLPGFSEIGECRANRLHLI